MTKLGIAINLERCVGCNTCANACKMQNNIPMNMLYIRVETDGVDTADGAQGTYPDLSRTYIPVACQHCENPACLKVCPVGATYKDDMGRVEIHYDKCIGCRICMAACPYQVRTRNSKTGEVDKCRFCTLSSYENGTKMCSCVDACLTGARIFGDLDDSDSEISKEIARTGAAPIAGDLTRAKIYYVR